jgi:prolyl-tRNA synthetase
MKYQELHIQTQREFPNNARTQGFGWLVRAGYMTRENEILPLGGQMMSKLRELSKEIPFFFHLELPFIDNASETFFESSAGSDEILYCENCGYVARKEIAWIKKDPYSDEVLLPLKKVETPESHTIEALANFLKVPKEKTAKALMYTRLSDNQFIFIVVRGDMQLSEAKLKSLLGDVRPATADEIAASGAVAGYASPIGLNAKRALIIVDDLIPQSPNLAAGANESGYHLLNTNCPRDYVPEMIEDITLAKEGDPCFMCGEALSIQRAEVLVKDDVFNFENILLALAETHHDDKGLTFPKYAAPFDVYLMHIAGKELDTRAKAEEIYNELTSAGFTVLFDDRDERAGVKFNDADLIGCPVRITVGEKNLKNGMVELKPRKADQNVLISQTDIIVNLKEIH